MNILFSRSIERSFDVERGGHHLMPNPHASHCFGGVLLALVAVGPLVGIAAAQNDSLPTLTQEGQQWARKLLDHSTKTAEGKTVKQAPFMTDAQVARLLQDAAVAADIAAAGTPMTQNEDFRRVRDVVEARVTAGEVVTFDDVAALFVALNAKRDVFPQPGVIGKSLSLLLTLAGFNPTAREAERNTEGQKLEFAARRHPEQVADIDFVNGVQTSLLAGVYTAALLSATLGRDVNHIHNAAGPRQGDVAQALVQALQLSTDPAIQQVTVQILEHAQADKPYILLCHSQGAMVCARGLSQALVIADDSALGDLRKKIARFTRVLSLGGWVLDSDFPEEMFQAGSVALVNSPCDPIPGTRRTIDFNRPLGQLKSILESAAELMFSLRCHSLGDTYLTSELPRILDVMKKFESEFVTTDLTGVWTVLSVSLTRRPVGTRTDCTICTYPDASSHGCRIASYEDVNLVGLVPGVGTARMAVVQNGTALEGVEDCFEGVEVPGFSCTNTLTGSVDGTNVSFTTALRFLGQGFFGPGFEIIADDRRRGSATGTATAGEYRLPNGGFYSTKAFIVANYAAGEYSEHFVNLSFRDGSTCLPRGPEDRFVSDASGDIGAGSVVIGIFPPP